MAKEITMEVKENFGNIGEKFRLNLVSWNGAAAKYDIRNWYTDKEGQERFGKGVTLTKEEARDLRDLLAKIDLG